MVCLSVEMGIDSVVVGGVFTVVWIVVISSEEFSSSEVSSSSELPIGEISVGFSVVDSSDSEL